MEDCEERKDNRGGLDIFFSPLSYHSQVHIHRTDGLSSVEEVHCNEGEREKESLDKCIT